MTIHIPTWQSFCTTQRPAVEQRLADIFTALDEHAPGLQRLHDAMRYAVMGAGKRLRPLAAMASAECLGAGAHKALDVGCAVELIHCYSLVHDDLPDMDNDTMRRGRPTVHVEFDPALAIMAGDALLTKAFELLTCAPHPGNCIHELCQAAGSVGMVGGQALDMAFETKAPTADEVLDMYARKTGALIAGSAALGAHVAAAPIEHIDILRQYGFKVGQSFQIADDLLGVHGDPVLTGKPVGRDAEKGKSTLVSLVGEAEATRIAEQLLGDALSLLEQLPGDTSALAGLAEFALKRSA